MMLWLNFFLWYGSVKWNTRLHICMRMTCDSHTNLIPELQIFVLPIPLGLIPILIPGFTKIHDSDSSSDSSSKWFRFWFRFQCFPKTLIPILIPIPASFDSDSNSDSKKPGFDSDSDSGIWFRFRNHLQLWNTIPVPNTYKKEYSYLICQKAMGLPTCRSQNNCLTHIMRDV